MSSDVSMWAKRLGRIYGFFTSEFDFKRGLPFLFLVLKGMAIFTRFWLQTPEPPPGSTNGQLFRVK
jgi:hypothetical protein